MRAHDPFPSPGDAFHRRQRPQPPSPSSPSTSASPPESALLQHIRAVLSPSAPSSTPRTLTSRSPLSAASSERVTWFDRSVVHSDGLTLLRQWNFTHEGEEGVVRHVCWAWFAVPPAQGEQGSEPGAGSGSGSGGGKGKEREREGEPTFGLFHQALHPPPARDPSPLNAGQSAPAQQTQALAWRQLALARGLCIFLRDVCRIFFPSGDEYTVHLPFLVRAAWPLYPSGLVIQREVDASERAPTPAPPAPDRLPALYTLSHPLGELTPVPAAPAVTGQIYYGRYVYAEQDASWRISSAPAPPVRGSTDDAAALSPEEAVLWMADRMLVPDPLAASYNALLGRLSVWLVLSVSALEAPGQRPEAVPLPTPAPAPPPDSQDPHKLAADRRKSKKGLQGGPLGAGDRDRRVSAVRPSTVTAAEGRTAMRVFSTSSQPVDAQTVQAAAAAATATATGQSAESQYPQLRQGEALATAQMQRPNAAPPQPLLGEQDGEEKMRPECMLRLVLTVDDLRDIDPSQLSIQIFDVRETHTVLAILLPTRELQLYELQRHAERLGVTKRQSLSAVSMTSVYASRPDIADLVVVCADGSVRVFMTDELALDFRIYQKTGVDGILAFGMRLVDPEDMREADEQRATAVQEPFGTSLTFTLEDGEKVRLELDLVPYSQLAKSCLGTICYALPPKESFAVMRKFLKARSGLAHGADDFEQLANVLLEMFLPGNMPYAQKPEEEVELSPWDLVPETSTYETMIDDPCLRRLRQAAPALVIYPPTTPTPAPSPYIAPLLLALHLLAEDYKAYTNRFPELARLVRLVVRLASVAQRDWAQYWMRECPSAVDAVYLTGLALRSSTLDRRLDFPPPNLMEYLGSYFTQASKQNYLILSQIGKFFGMKASSIMGAVDPCRRTSMLLEIYTSLRSPQDGALHISQAVHVMSLYGLTPEQLNTVPLGMALPLWEALRKTRYRPPSTAPRRFYQLCGRDDLAMTVFGLDRTLNVTDSFRQRNEPDTERQHSIVKLYGEAYVSLAGRAKEETTGVGDHRVRHFTDVRFPDDYRLREVETMLRSSRTCVIRVQDRPDASDHDLANEHQMLIMRIAERTLSLPLGRAALTFATVPTAQADSYTLPPLEFSVKILPQGSVLNLDGARLTDDVRYWTEFNNAVAAALRIAPATEGVDYSWIILLNKPPELSSKHAGFIFGLGLTGHLRSMLPFQAFGYLAPKHNFTTIAVLLGLAAAHCGTANETVTQMISVHTPALLPPNSAELNIPVLTQAAGLTGLGLLYLGTRNRRMARIALQEISRKDLVKPGQTDEHRESYVLSAGFAFGFIMVGKGAQSNPADMAMVNQLQLLIHGETPTINQTKYQKPNFDVTITSPAAIIALMLMFMRTERQDVADMLRPPKTKEELTHYAPYLIMLRTIARSVIMWNSVSLRVEWLYANLPDFLARLLKNASNAGQVLSSLDDATSLAYMYTIAGLCFGIGLRYVGSADAEALTRLSMLHDAANKAMALSMTGYDQRIKRFAYKECVGAIQLAMAMVAAGTGDLNIFQRLRIAHGQYNNVRYGTHVATHLSLGLLFLGNGRYTLGNSNAAIACLIASLYPRFPNNAADNRAHPQVLRHLWVLAAEPRCLITRDVDTGKIVGLPIRLRKKEGNTETAMRMMAPNLLPEIEKIVSLEVDSPRYSPLSLDIMNNARHRASMIRDQTMWVKRQPGFLTYEEDMRGTRNINLHTNVAYLDTIALDFPSSLPLDPEVSEHLFKFINSSAHSMRTVAFAKYLCRPPGGSPKENALFAFSHAALVECLALDKLNMLHTYLSVILSQYDHPSDNMDAVTVLRSLRIASSFYETQFSRFMDEGTSVNRSVMLRPSLIQSALLEAEKKADELSQDPRFRAVLPAYVRGEGLVAEPTTGDSESGAESSMREVDEDTEDVDEDVLARELAFFLAIYNFPSLKVLLEAREHGRTATQILGAGAGEVAQQLPAWLALMILKGGAAMSGDRQLPSERITTRAVEEIIKAWTK